MILTTTDSLETHQIIRYLGIVGGQAIFYARKLREMKMSAQAELLARAKEKATQDAITKAEDLGANAIVGVNIDFETVNGAFHVLVTGTAVKCQRKV